MHASYCGKTAVSVTSKELCSNSCICILPCMIFKVVMYTSYIVSSKDAKTKVEAKS